MADKSTGSAKFKHVLKVAEDSLWSSFEQARVYGQGGDIGDSREDALVHFLRDRLPSRFAVVSGEVVDMNGNQSGQTDIIIYDSDLTAPLLAHGKGNVLLPAEALLATVEVKSKVTAGEITKSVNGIKKIHALRPWDAPYGLVSGTNGSTTDPGLPRILTTVFAYKSDLGQVNWASKELARLREACKDVNLPIPCVDRMVVLDRGLINPAHGKALIPNEKRVLGHWFFNLMNFLARESQRRRPFPWSDYEHPARDSWLTAGSPQFDAPEARRATAVERQRARRKRYKKLNFSE